MKNNIKEIDQFISYCFEGNTDKVLDMLDNNIFIHANVVGSNGSTPLIAAINGESLEVVESLITWVANVNNGNWTPLHEIVDLSIDSMIQNNKSEIPKTLINIMRELIDSGADLNKKNKEGESPLELIKSYSTDETSFNFYKDCFRVVVPDIDDLIKY